MVASKAASRAVSVVSNGNARDTLKRRSKPYKTEQQKILTKKQKLNVKTSYHQQSPQGYHFLPLGTPELAELCKELSRKRNLPVNVVNAATGHPDARDPSKVSHHVHRVGYHFRCEIVEEACETLGYVHYDNTFITTADLQQKQHNSVVAKAFAKLGLNYDRVKGNDETPDQIRGAIKELYPKIPQSDLDEVVNHSWKEGEKRVGNATDIPLPRRVQLAVTARIRHMYTDYDALLSAFGDWKNVRKEVEPATLKKLIEWRGETGEDDETLEEIVRETIVIDDDEDDEDDGSSDGGDASDSSIEISHRPAAEEDLRAEEASERDHRFFQRRRPEHMQAHRNDVARAKIQAFRSQEHNARAYAHNQPAAYQHPPHVPIQRIYAPPHDTVDPPRQVVVGGQVLRLIRNEAPASYANPAGPYFQQDRPMQSIERDDRVNSPPPAQRSHPTTPRAARPMQRPNQYVDLSQESPGYAQPLQNHLHRQYETRQQAHHSREIVDLTSSPRRLDDERYMAQPEVIRVVSTGDGRYVQAPVDHSSYARAPEGVPHVWPAEASHAHGRPYDANAAEYDPTRPLLDVRETGLHRTAPSTQYASPAQPPWRQREQVPIDHAYRPDQPTVQYGYHAAVTYPAPVPQSHSAPVPVHGAPAPVQQMPRELASAHRNAHRRYQLAAAEAQRQSMGAASQPAQYYPG